MSLQRVSVKYFVRQPESIDPGVFTSVFQRWIQEHTVEGLLIDVVDYKHVYQGPGVILIGYEADYALDLADGQPGLLYTRKRGFHHDLHNTLYDVFRLALIAAEKIQDDDSLGDIRFDTTDVLISFHDRLAAPNTSQTLDLVRDDVERVVRLVYGDSDFDIKLASDDLRHLFGIRVLIPAAQGLSQLIEKLNVDRAVSG